MEITKWNDHEGKGVLSYCDHCGFAIYSAKDALRVHATRDLIHKDCLSDYSDEHMFDLAQSLDENSCLDRED